MATRRVHSLVPPVFWWVLFVPTLLIMVTVTTMPMMHKKHHQWAQEEDREWQNPQQMRCMFRDEKEGSNRQKTKQDPGHRP